MLEDYLQKRFLFEDTSFDLRFNVFFSVFKVTLSCSSYVFVELPVLANKCLTLENWTGDYSYTVENINGIQED